MIIHINGMPGVGKLTVARLTAEKLNARLVDNHLAINLAVSICERGSVEYFYFLVRLTDVILEQILKNPRQTYIFTNALTTELPEDKKRLDGLREFAENNQITFVQILIECNLAENKRRIVSASRNLQGKLSDAEDLDEIYKNYTVYHPPCEFALTLDTTNRSAQETATEIVKFVENLS